MASTDVAPAQRASGWLRAGELLDREGLLVAVVTVCVGFIALRLGALVSQDTWYMLLGGREVVHHGLPGADTLTYWTAGRRWIDQQWLAQSLAYAVYSLGGLRLVVLVLGAVAAAAIALTVYGGRRSGAGPRAVTAAVILAAFLLFAAASQVRAQTLAYPLFVIVFLLLVEDSRAPSRRVLLTVPILALWANVHGSVVLGAALVALRGVELALGRSRRARGTGALLVAGSVAALLATPFGFGIVDYYRATLFNSSFDLITEWQSPALSAGTFPLYLFAAAALWLLGRYHRSFTRFQTLALLALLGGSFWSVRNMAWLAFAAPPLLAPALENIFSRPRAGGPRTNSILAVACGAAALVAIPVGVVRADRAPAKAFPTRAAAIVAGVAEKDPSARIFANERYGDWLLFSHPELRGRIAYDIRFELLTGAELTAITDWRSAVVGRWLKAPEGARILVLDPRTERPNEEALLAEPGVRRIYRDHRVSVLLRLRAD